MKILSIDNKDEAKIIIKLCNSKDKKIKWVETTEKSGKLEFLESHYINNDDFSVELFFNSEFITLEFVIVENTKIISL